MRTFFGVVLLVLGVPILLAGGASAVYVGPDDTVGMVDEDISTDTAVVVSGPTLLDVTGPTVHVSAEAGDAETFIGTAHPVHVDSYLDGVAVERITDATWRGEVTMDTVDGEAETPATPPGELDWWTAQSAGAGEQGVSLELTDEPVRIVVSGVEPAAPLDVRLMADVEVDSLFVTTLLVAGVGLLLVVAGVLLIVSGRRRKRRARARASAPGDDDGTRGAGGTDDTSELTPQDPEVTPPTPLRPRGPGRYGRLARLAAPTATGALVLAGCAELPDDADPAAHTSVVAATPEMADAFFAHYTETNNQANADRDGELIGTVEAGPLLTSSQMAYQIQQAQERDPIEPFTVVPETVAALEFDAYPMWFVALTEPAEDSGPGYYLVTRENAASSWQAVLSVYAPSGTDVVEPTINGGAATIAGDEAGSRGADVLQALVEYADTGSEPENIDVENAGGLNSLHQSGLEIVEGPEDPVNVERSCALEGGDPRWLATGSGAMALAAISCTQQVMLDEGFSITLGEEGYGTIPGNTNLTEVTITHGVSVVVSVNDDGSATVIGESMLPYAMDHTEEPEQSDE